jgi:sulfofructose kinase
VSDAVANAGDLPRRVDSTRIICLGLSAQDQIWRVDRLFAGNSEKIRGLEFSTTGGGMAANAAVTVARLGGHVAFWGRAGVDPAGHAMREALAEEGVDVAQFRLFPQASSSVSGIIVDAAGERQIVNFRGRLPEAADWLPLGEVAGAAAALADPRWVSGAVALFQAARAAGVPTVLDAEVADPEAFEALLPLTDHAVFSEPALQAFAGPLLEEALTEVAAGYGCRVAAVTRGADGVMGRMDDAIFNRAAYAVPVVDTNGAGDVFHGAYVLAIGAGLSVVDAVSFASAAAALKCTRLGGRAGIPTLEECLAFQRDYS